MARPDHSGARGSNAGDDFHELWALRHALTLLHPETTLREVMVEGVAERDEQGAIASSWDGVDCTRYCAAPGSADVTSIVIEQMKYSSAAPTGTWTVARVVQSTAKSGNNSVIRKLATAWNQLCERYPDLSARNAVTVRLVSNQAASPELLAALGALADAKAAKEDADQAERLRVASGLSKDLFKKFIAAFDVSNLGLESRLSVETAVINTIASWTDDNARQSIGDLTRFIRKKMAPDERGRPITKEDVLTHFGVSDIASIFPCPNRLKRVANSIRREATSEIVRRMIARQQLICLHGHGGAGKTTVVQQLADSLPPGSEIVVFDCYGAGTYMNSNGHRHPPHYAFRQIINELSARLRIPYLLVTSAHSDYPRLFMKQLTRAAGLLQSANPDALLVIVIDAADNSIDAAAANDGATRSFVRDFLTLEPPPSNVRFLVTARTGRLDTLQAPPSFERVPLTGFTLTETREHVRALWPTTPDSWIEDFQKLSNGLPRVQAYAIEAAHGDQDRALQYLRPAGKGLTDIFRGQIEDAIRKQANPNLFNRFCAGLISLPRPIPMEALAATVGLSQQHCIDITSDLAPGLTIADDQVSFADEDFETYVREQAATELPSAIQAAAEFLFTNRAKHAYAAAHVATALYHAKRSSDVLTLVAAEEAPTAIADPVHRRDVEVKRLQLAVKVCRDTGNSVDSVLTLIRGARALKTDTSIRRLLIENSDLSVEYARDVAVRAVLRNPEEIKEHGPLLSALAVVEARHGRRIEVREIRRQLQAWFGRRDVELAEHRKQHPDYEPQAWRLEPEDLAGWLEAVLITEPAENVLRLLRQWPHRFAFKAARTVTHRVAARGDFGLLRSIADALPKQSPWRFIVTLPLALAGDPIVGDDLNLCLQAIVRRRLISTENLSRLWSSQEPVEAEFYDCVMLLCEVALLKGVSPELIRPILQMLSHESLRIAGQVRVSQTTVLDISIRAFALLQELDGKPLSYDTYVVQPPEPKEADKDRPQQTSRRRDEEKEYIAPLLPIYAARAKAFLGRLTASNVAPAIAVAAGGMDRERWRIQRHHSAGLAFDRAAKSVAQLIVIDAVDLAALRSTALGLLTSDHLASKASQLFAYFALRQNQHGALLSEITARADKLKQLKSSARDRSDGLMNLCRTLSAISPEDAKLMFGVAVDITAEIDEDSVHELALIKPLAAKGADALDDAGRRRVAQRLVAVSSEMALRLDSPDGFPWSSIIKALVDLDAPVALAAIAQWDDIERVQLGTTVPAFISRALILQKIDAATAIALLPLLVHAPEKLLSVVAKHAAGNPGLIDLMAQDERLAFGQGQRDEVNQAIASVAQGTTGATGYVGKLAATAEFLTQNAPKQKPNPHDVPREVIANKYDEWLSQIDWSSARFNDPASLEAFLDNTANRASASGGMFYSSKLLEAQQARVPLSERPAYLRALARCHPIGVWWEDIARSIVACATAWSEMPSIKAWCRDELPAIIAAELPSFARYLAMSQAVLNKALPLIESQASIRDALLSGVETHFDALDASTVYALAGLIGNSCSAAEAANIIDRHSAQLLLDLAPEDRQLPDPSSIPTDSMKAVARFLLANLSDVDIHRRWRAAHATHRLTLHGDDSVIPALIASYTQTTEGQFRDPRAPFHWHAARLWLMIAFARAAVDKPRAFLPHLAWLKSVVTDPDYPHLLVRLNALDTIQITCTAAGTLLNKSELEFLTKCVTGAVKRKSLPSKQSYRPVHMRNLEGKRFQFDAMDTLPYWYEPAVRIFADLTGEEFVAEAERWIVDQWGVTGFLHRWDDQPRRHKYGEGYDTLHRHGSLPQRERYHTQLEWHAMWCTVGTFLATRPLVRSSDGFSDNLEEWLERSKLTLPPRWLADLHDAKPLHADWWFAPADVSDAWLDDVDLDDALGFLNSAPDPGSVVVCANAEAHSGNHTISKRVSSALVSPDTAADLMRALQSTDSEQDYYLPDEDHDQETRHGKFQLLGWCATTHRETAFDGEDPLRYGISAPQSRPGRRIMAVTELQQRWKPQRIEWVTVADQVAFSYHCWGDTRGDESEQQRRYISELRSSGSLLCANRQALKQILSALKLDLIVEVVITKRNFSYEGSSRGKEEDHKAQPHAFIFLFRRSGEIETIEGPVGTWQAPC